MFSALRRSLGIIKVTESPTEISVQGIPADTLARDISKMWSTNRINQNLFNSIGKNSFSFHPFFAVEVHYMLQQIDKYRNARSTGRVVRAIINELEQKTWLKRITEETKSRVNISRLSNLTVKLFDHQINFINNYGTLTEKYGLNGYLLAAKPGTGKTIMSLGLAEALEADLVVVICPKNALNQVWTNTVSYLYKKPRPYWAADEEKPYKGEKIIIGHYEALAKVMETARRASHSKAVVILDESHYLNELKSLRTQLFLQLCKAVRTIDVLEMSGTPYKAMGYEAIPLLKAIDPLFTDEVEKRFLKIFGKASDRALDILKHRLGKISYHVSSNNIIEVTQSTENWDIALPNGNEYTLDAVREKMRKYVTERLAHYQSKFKDYQKAYDLGLKAFEATMQPGVRDDYKKYQRAIREISRSYDPVAHKDLAIFANHFEHKVIIPAIRDKAIRDGFKNAKSVIKYVKLKVVGEALGSVVGKARIQCHIDLVRHIDWKRVADMSAKKVIVFTSYVDVIKAAEEAIKKAGFKAMLVYGDTNSNVSGIVTSFAKDPDTKFLIATYQSLSTAVPLVMADVTTFTNQPWRNFEKEQAIARTVRIGQDSPVKLINTYLDTGKEPNISTRSKEILEWSKAMVDAMIGQEDSEGIAKELNREYNLGAMEAYIEPATQFKAAFASMEAYHTLDEGTFIHHGKKYDLNRLLEKAQRLPVQSLPVEDLKWVLAYDMPDPELKEKADKNQPLLVVREPHDGKHADTVVDGFDRLSRMVDDGDVLASVKVIPLDWLEETLV